VFILAEMPNCCCECPLHSAEGDPPSEQCNALEELLWYDDAIEKRHEKCPLQPIAAILREGKPEAKGE